MPEQKFFMGVDVGTNSTKGILIDSDLKVISMYETSHVMKNPAPHMYEHDAEKDWWGDWCRVSKGLLSKSGISSSQICAIGTSALGADLVPVDSEGNPLRRAILYGIDSRAEAEIDELNQRCAENGMTSQLLDTGSVAPKILWLKKHEPQIWARTYKFLTASSFITEKLTDKYVIDRYMSSTFYPLYNNGQVHDGRYDWIAGSKQLCQVKESADIAGYITPKAAIETGLSAGTPVLTGTDDSGAEAVSVGVTCPGQMMIQLGSSMYLTLGTDGINNDTCLHSEEFLVPNLYCLSGATNTFGSLTKWCLDNLYPDYLEKFADPYARMEEEGAKVKAGSDGLITLPYFAGERTPILDPNSCGVFFGMQLSHTRAHIYRSILEGCAFSIAQHLEIIQNIPDCPVKRIIAVGGGTKNELWLQIISDVSGRAICVPKVCIGASYGDSLMAAMASGKSSIHSYSDIASHIEIDKIYYPDQDKHKSYTVIQELFDSLYPIVKDQMHHLSKLRDIVSE